jgi:hypothetical protein
LVITSNTNKFSSYLGEILSAEGYNEFTLADISDVNSSVLSNFDTVVLGDISLTPAQVTMFTNWVNAGGNLIAMSPDPQLASLLGITSTGATLSDAYVGIDTSQAPGAGIVSQTIQYHSSADRYTLNGARAVATLYSNATTPTTNPAVTIRSVGAGQAAAFTFDLARSIVYTRQGNPAWVGQERDDPVQNIVKVLDMMYPDYLDLNKVSIPQADEMQRLFANLILTMQQNSNKKPLPHFWYLPNMLKAVVLAAEDDHDAGGVADIFNQMLAASPAGCSIADWTCYRGTAWAYRNSMDPTTAPSYEAQGFDIGSHPNTGCRNYTSYSDLDSAVANELNLFRAAFPGLPPQRTDRLHCTPFTDWASVPLVSLAHGIRLDMSPYYAQAKAWINNRPGYMTGSGNPMRYANLDGSAIDVYQVSGDLVDNPESGITTLRALTPCSTKRSDPRATTASLVRTTTTPTTSTKT